MSYGFDFHKFDLNKFDEKTLEVVADDSEQLADEYLRNITKILPTDHDDVSDEWYKVIKPHRYDFHNVSDKYLFDITANRITEQEIQEVFSAEKVNYIAVVYVGGYKIRVKEGLTIKDSANSRVSTCSFELSNVKDWMLDVLKIRANIHVMLFDGNKTDFFGGRITKNPISWRGHSPTIKIEAEDYTATADDYIVNQSYHDKFVHEIVYEMWTEFYGEKIEFDIQESSAMIPSIVFQFESLFDATETLAEQLGWTWFIDWDGAKKTLKFFSPETNVFPDVLGLNMNNVLENGLEFSEDYEIYNAIYFFGGQALSEPLTEKDVADGEKYVYSFIYEPTDIIVKVNGVEQKIGIENIHNFDEDDVDCLVNYNEKALRFPEDNPPEEGAIIEKTYRYRYPVVTYVENDVSIEKYGKIVKEIREPKITDIRQAQERARYLLRKYSTPRINGKMNIKNVYGLRAGHIVEVELPSIGISGFFEVAEIKKVALSTRINTSVSLNKVDDPETQIAEKLKEFAKRLKALELLEIGEEAVVHRYKQEFENLLINENVIVASRTAGVTFFDDARFNHADFV